MPPETICKTVHQYNKQPILEEDMKKLQEIAEDYSKVKNYVYARYGGIHSLAKLYPGYTVQNEMTNSGLRGELGLPSVYFYLAVFDALGDIKGQWVKVKSQIQKSAGCNQNFTEEEKHYIRFLLKVNNALEAVLSRKPLELPGEIGKAHEQLAEKVNQDKLCNYVRRQVRKYFEKHGRLHTDVADGFAIAERAYRYGEGGIYISTKENRKRIFVVLTDKNQYKSQLYVKLYPQRHGIEIKAPVKVAVRKHEDYQNQVGVSMGMYTMLTTDEGHSYGIRLGEYQTEYADWIREQTQKYNREKAVGSVKLSVASGKDTTANAAANPKTNCTVRHNEKLSATASENCREKHLTVISADNQTRKKYNARKNRLEEKLHSYINHELNVFLQTEKPRVIYMAKLPRPKAGGKNKQINYSVTMWQRGYIRSRLQQKCKEQSVEIVEVLGKGISVECSCCGEIGSKKDGIFSCPSCGYSIEEKTNTARNVLKRGIEGKVLH